MWIDAVFPWLRPSLDESVTPMNVLAHRAELVDVVVQLCGWFFLGGLAAAALLALGGFMVRDIVRAVVGFLRRRRRHAN
jgi:hypothetical protein